MAGLAVLVLFIAAQFAARVWAVSNGVGFVAVLPLLIQLRNSVDVKRNAPWARPRLEQKQMRIAGIGLAGLLIITVLLGEYLFQNSKLPIDFSAHFQVLMGAASALAGFFVLAVLRLSLPEPR